MLNSATNVAWMDANTRKAIVTPEHIEEARALKALWDAVPKADRLSQEVFGEKHKIGNQSAVGQFLRGGVPLSLKAASGFAKGLGVDIAAFSPRLAQEAATFGTLVAPDPSASLERSSPAPADEELTRALLVVGRAIRATDELTKESVVPSLQKLARGPTEIGQIAQHIVFLLSKSRRDQKPPEDRGKKGGFEDFDFTPSGTRDGQGDSAEEQERGRGVRSVSGRGSGNG